MKHLKIDQPDDTTRDIDDLIFGDADTVPSER